MRYFRPKSLTWWGGITSILLGITALVCVTCDLGEVSRLMTMLLGGADTSPAGMIMLGIVAIGLYDKQTRDQQDLIAGLSDDKMDS